ncbi:MAG TPA: VOC family protein [Terriglobales bacterium]|nr:VOC family protein [Terriglobales bacterium]
MQFNPYLFFNGQCETAFKFYEKIFDGKITAMMTHEGTPASEQVPAEWRKKIMHACLNIGDQRLMASDNPPEHFQKPQGFYVSVQIKEPADAERVFAALSKDGKINLPIQQTFWARRFGMLVDQFGTPWMINCE